MISILLIAAFALAACAKPTAAPTAAPTEAMTEAPTAAPVEVTLWHSYGTGSA
jgi:ABC-type glycerol-3-phosphate transport system substrate-binding protein